MNKISASKYAIHCLKVPNARCVTLVFILQRDAAQILRLYQKILKVSNTNKLGICCV